MSKKGKDEAKEKEVIEVCDADILCKVRLTQEELLAAGERMADQQGRLGDLEAELNELKSMHKAKVSAVEGELARLVALIRAKYDHRNVKCVVTKNFTQGTVKVVRTDMDPLCVEAVVESRPMTSDECQRGLALFEQKQADDAKEGNDNGCGTRISGCGQEAAQAEA